MAKSKGSPVSLSYQGGNNGSGKAYSRGTLLQARGDIERMVSKYPKLSEEEALIQIRAVSSPNDDVTVYRATPGGSINSGDWVFLSRKQADSWSRSPFTGKPKVSKEWKQYQVIATKTKAKNVGWSGKNLEFVYTGKRSIR